MKDLRPYVSIALKLETTKIQSDENRPPPMFLGDVNGKNSRPPRDAVMPKSLRIYTDKLKKEPFEEMRQRLLQRGQRQLKSQAEYLLQHMGLSSLNELVR